MKNKEVSPPRPRRGIRPRFNIELKEREYIPNKTGKNQYSTKPGKIESSLSRMVQGIMDKTTVPINFRTLQDWASNAILEDYETSPSSNDYQREDRLRGILLEKLRNDSVKSIAIAIAGKTADEISNMFEKHERRVLMLSYMEGLRDEEAAFISGMNVLDYKSDKASMIARISKL